MKISNILQMQDFSIMLLAGFAIGTIYGILNGISNMKKRLVIKNITDFISYTASFALYFILINMINWGETRAFLIAGYVIGIILERITLGKIFAKGYKYVYTILVRIVDKFKHSAIGKVILK